jgi:putative GTP pyrophosphokinase
MTVEDVCHLPAGLPPAIEFGHSSAEFSRFVLPYQFAIQALTTKVAILKEEFTQFDRDCPIEHVSSRVKSFDRILAKAQRLRCPLTTEHIRRNIRDIAGVRITCPVISDTYRVAGLLSSQPDVTVIEVEDYIAKPKPNGYKSLHITVEIPVVMSDGVEQVPVELQIRTIAMDLWAGFEHTIYRKNHRAVPRRLVNELTEAAEVAHRLDMTMERLHNEVAWLTAGNADDIHLDVPPLTTSGTRDRTGPVILVSKRIATQES